MTSKYTLHYFDLPARGEFIRFIFHAAGVKFTDKRYSFSDMTSVKANDKLFPLGQLPSLEVNDEVICQSHTIARYLANEFNLNGKTGLEKAAIDQVLDTLKHFQETMLGGYFWKKDVEEKNKHLENLFENYAPRAYKMIENLLKKNNDGKDFLVGHTVTIGDIMIMNNIETIQLHYNLEKYRNFIDAYPLIKSLNEKVRNTKGIKEYIELRGAADYSKIMSPKF